MTLSHNEELIAQAEALELVTAFRAYSKGFRTYHTTGEATMVLGCPISERDAMEVVDKFPGYMFTIMVWRKPRRRRRIADDGE